MAFEQYAPNKVSVTYSGVVIVGFMDGTFVECERNEDAYTTQVGSLGDVTRTKSFNRTGKITITLMQHAPTNDFLSGFLAADELGDTPPGVIMVKDTTNKMLAIGTPAWIMKAPKIERGKESAGIQWVFECANLEIVPSVS